MANSILGFLAGLLGVKRTSDLTDRPIIGLMVGIGNDEEKYRGTRHNIGFDVADQFINRCSETESVAVRYSKATICRISDKAELVVAKPTTYVNRSGSAISELLSLSKLAPESCLVVVDDINLPLGTIRSRGKGSDGGHNGLKSIIGEIGKGFPRLRLGVGPVPEGTALVDFVLGPFSPDEMPLKKRITDLATEAVMHWGHNGIESTMSRYNTMLDVAKGENGKSDVNR